MTKIKAYELSKGFVGIPGKELVKILSDYGISEKSHMSALDERELDIIFEYVTQRNQVEDFSVLFAEVPAEEPVKDEKKSETDTDKAAVEEPDAEKKPAEKIESEGGFASDAPARKTRVVDTRANNVDLDRLDNERLEELVPENVKSQGGGKQKIKTGNKKSKLVKEKQDPKAFEKIAKKEKKQEAQVILVPDSITVGELAERLEKSSTEVIKKLNA